MGTTLHEGEYILISHKITNETGSLLTHIGNVGYTLLTHIGINTSKVNFLGSTRHFCTYAVIKDLELPFSTSEWQDFEVKNVRFHAYTMNLKNLILMEHDEDSFDYLDEMNRFFEIKERKKKEKEEKEKENSVFLTARGTGKTVMTMKHMLNSFYGINSTDFSNEKEKKNMLNNNTFSISNDSAWANKIDDVIFADNMAYMAATQSVPDKLPDITLEDLTFESSVRTEPLIRGTLRVSPGVVRQPSRFHFTQYAGYKYLFEGGYINGKKPPLKFKLIFGQEHATGRYKTICLWEDGEKTIIHGDNKVTKLPVAQAFAWCYVKRTFGTVSHFKKHVDKRTTKMDGVWYFEGDCVVDDYAQGSVPGTSKKRDIYDAAALAIVTKRYGGLRKLVDEYINKEDENGTR